MTTVPAGDDPPRTFNEGDQRLNIERLQPRFNAQVQRSHGQHSEEVAVAAHFSEFASAAQPLELLLLLRCHHSIPVVERLAVATFSHRLVVRA